MGTIKSHNEKTLPHQKLSLKSCGISPKVLTKSCLQKYIFHEKDTYSQPTSHSHETSG